LPATVCCRYLVGGELARDLAEAIAGCVLGSDSLDDIGRDRGGASRLCDGLGLRSSWPAALCEQPLYLVDAYLERATVL
jgi:hypothetical protein